MKYQAKKLMEEMISSKNISFKEDWKVKKWFSKFQSKKFKWLLKFIYFQLVFVHVGANDLCKEQN